MTDRLPIYFLLLFIAGIITIPVYILLGRAVEAYCGVQETVYVDGTKELQMMREYY